jgi:hypothetical protein
MPTRRNTQHSMESFYETNDLLEFVAHYHGNEVESKNRSSIFILFSVDSYTIK